MKPARFAFVFLASSCGGEAPSEETTQPLFVLETPEVSVAVSLDDKGVARATLRREEVLRVAEGLRSVQLIGQGEPIDQENAFDALDPEVDGGLRASYGPFAYSGSSGASTRFDGRSRASSGFSGSSGAASFFSGSLSDPTVTPSCDLTRVCSWFDVLCAGQPGCPSRSACFQVLREVRLTAVQEPLVCASLDLLDCVFLRAGVGTSPERFTRLCQPEFERYLSVARRFIPFALD